MDGTMEQLSIEETLEKLHKQISFLAYKFHNSLHLTIEDAKQTARVSILLTYNKNPTFDNLENFYFKSINTYFIDEIRKLSRKKRCFTIASETSNLATSKETIAEELLTNDYVAKFTSDQQQIVLLLLKGYTLREIAVRLDISLGNCHGQLQQIRDEVKAEYL